MKAKTYTVVAVCRCGCDTNEIHILKRKSAESAAKYVANENGRKWGGKDKRVIAVFEGEQFEARKSD